MENFLSGTVLEVEAAKKRFLNDAKNKTKAAVSRNMPRTAGVRRHQHRKRFIDDIQASLVDDKEFGGKRALVRGGRDTGTLWHILNNGTRRSRATNFMDKAIADVDGKLDATLDIVMREEFGK